MEKIKVGITQGDANGVGPEIIIKALAPEGMTDLMTPVIFANKGIILANMQQLKGENFRFQAVNSAAEARDGKINLVNVGEQPLKPDFGQASAEAGRSAYDALEAAVEALEEGDIDVLVTAPINKATIHSDDFNFPGHTEYLEARFSGEEGEAAKAQMILFNENLRVALLTTHLPLSEVSEHVTEEAVIDAARRFDATLRRDFGCDRPRIAVLSLNPHAGDNGLLGREEKEVLLPALQKLREHGVLAFGPYAADGFFGSGEWRKFDGVLAMYHDQGLAPFKTIAGQDGVNFTAGLEAIRTSPDHGTAYDIAGRMKADASSMRRAIYEAIDIYRRRERYDEMTANPLK